MVTSGKQLTGTCTLDYPVPMPKVKKQISLFVEPEQLQTLQTLSEVTLAPVGALIRAAIDDYLEKRKAEIKSVKK
jgi:hypothetical protein